MTEGGNALTSNATASKVDPFWWWRRALTGKFEIGGPNLPIHEGHPQRGFYRKRIKSGGRFIPVAIWETIDGEIVATVNGERQDANRVWLYCCKHPVSQEAYEKACGSGGQWPDADEAIASIGHNAPPDSIELFRDQIQSATDGVELYVEIRDDDECKRAQSLRSRCLELARDADKERDTLKRPHFEAGKLIDADWQPIIKAARAGAATLATKMGKYQTAKAIEKPQQVIDQIRGGYGKAASVRVVKVITRVEDWDRLWSQFGTDNEVQDALVRAAQKRVDAGHTVQGVIIEEQRKVR